MHHGKESNTEGKWLPANREELLELVKDETINLGDINTSRITDMHELFADEEGKEYRKDYSGIGTWNVSNVTDMGLMFYRAESFNEDISRWDVSKVETMESMFCNASSFNQPIGDWNVSNVKDMRNMFLDADSFKQDIRKWNVSAYILKVAKECVDNYMDNELGITLTTTPTFGEQILSDAERAKEREKGSMRKLRNMIATAMRTGREDIVIPVIMCGNANHEIEPAKYKKLVKSIAKETGYQKINKLSQEDFTL